MAVKVTHTLAVDCEPSGFVLDDFIIEVEQEENLPQNGIYIRYSFF